MGVSSLTPNQSDQPVTGCIVQQTEKIYLRGDEQALVGHAFGSCKEDVKKLPREIDSKRETETSNLNDIFIHSYFTH